MTKQSTINQLETVIGKLSNLNYVIEGNRLQEAIRMVAKVRDNIELDKKFKPR